MASTYFIDAKGYIKILIAALLLSLTGNGVQWWTKPEPLVIDTKKYETQIAEKDRTIASLRNVIAVRDGEKKKLEVENGELKKKAAEKEIVYIKTVKEIPAPDTVGEACIQDYKKCYSAWQQCDSIRNDYRTGWERCEKVAQMQFLDIEDMHKIIAEKDKQLVIVKNWNAELTRAGKQCHCGRWCLVTGVGAFILGVVVR